MSLDPAALLGAALSLRVGVDASGVGAELASKLTEAERAAITSADRVSSETGRLSDAAARSVTASSEKVTVAQLRVTAAQERYNRLLQDESATQGQRASAQATLISAQARQRQEQERLNEVQERGEQGLQRITLALGAAGVAAAAFAIKSAHTFEEVGGEIRGLTRITGDTVEESSRLRYAAQETGVEYNALSTAIRTAERHLVAQDDAAKAVGVSLRDATGQARPFGDVLGDIANRFADMPDGAEKTALAIGLFGRNGAALIPLLNKGASGLSELGDEAGRLGLVLDNNAVDSLTRATKATRDLHAASEAVQVSIGEHTLPVITRLKELTAGGLRFIAEHDELAATAAGGTLLAGAFGKLGSAASNFNEIITAGSAILARWRTRTAVAENAALAGSYNAVAAAASRAATAELAAGGAAGLGGAGAARVASTGLLSAGSVIGAGMVAGLPTTRGLLLGAGGRLLRGGLYAGGGALVGSTVPGTVGSIGSSALYGAGAGAIIPGVGPLVGAVGGTAYGGTTAILHAIFGQRIGRDYKPVELGAGSQAFVDKYGGGDADVALATFRAQSEAEQAATEERHQAVLRAFQGEAFTAPPERPDRAALTGAVSSARTDVAAAQRAVATAELALSQARKSDTATALTLARAEDSLAGAKTRAVEANKRLAAAEKERRQQLGPTRLTPDQLQNRLDRTVQDKRQELESIGVLAGEGLGNAAIRQIATLDQEAPGTLRYAADHMTQSMVREMNESFRRLKRLASPVADFLDDKASVRKAGAVAAEQFALGFDNRLSSLARRRNRNDYFSAQDPRAHALSGGVGDGYAPGVRRIG